MCGRYHIESEEDIVEMRKIIEEINRRYYGTDQHIKMKTGEIFPTDTVPIISQSGPELMTWGLPMPGKSRTIINAKSETVFERPMFRAAAAGCRVAVPTTGFYEWTHEGGKAKDKFLFRLPDEDMLYLAGLYTQFRLPGGRERRFAIITTAANLSMSPYHDRMPVCLGRGERDAWIRDSAFAMEALSREQPDLIPIKVDELSS